MGKSFVKDHSAEFSVLDHIEELRWRLIRAVVIILVFTVVAFIYMPYIFHTIILAHAYPDFWTYRMLCRIDNSLCVDTLNFTLLSREMSGQFTIHLKSAFIVGFIAGFPFIVWEIWKYIKPALHKNEINVSFKVVSVVPFLFIIGILFGYFILAPLSVNFLANYNIDAAIQNQFDITSYVSTVTIMVLVCGLIFQLPVLVYFLAMAGILTPEFMRKYRRVAIILVFIIAGIITPSPDIMSQLIVAIPIYLLYEISIYTAASISKKRKMQEV
ncbi:Sec-independent protein translocase TatC [Cytophaga hutchinsonii ATCC 33406]|uniref:Sec-independent protein translocase protein TatC n=1 Tax=Cytophaga hutchinsonii (strain ATCC 33406 / DSM 1761 / CIP 103989 / NBRC 15051 / NCIMB 9469 / D465) TaxID=269798 RepID=A0A6N4SQV5_CYTH3|nr:Sec-independent protein translocase TatC [Cytophaga hutchinsonii ATCC 33406]